jgi:hypothetical protein
VFHIASTAAALAKDVLAHGHGQQQQQQEGVSAASNINSSNSSSQQTIDPSNWLMLIGRACVTAGHALEQCCTLGAAAVATTVATTSAAAVASVTDFGEAASAATGEQLEDMEWIAVREHPLHAMRCMSAVFTWLGLQLRLLLPSYTAGMQQQQQQQQQQLMQQQEQLLASLRQATAALQEDRLDDSIASLSEAKIKVKIAAVMQAMHAANIQGQGGQLLPLSQQLSSFGAALCAAVPVRCCCNNPGCSELGEASELELVSGKSSRCSGCKLARYHSAECLKAHWQDHKLVCRAIAAQQ